MRITAIDDHISQVEIGEQPVQNGIYRRSGKPP